MFLKGDGLIFSASHIDLYVLILAQGQNRMSFPPSRWIYVSHVQFNTHAELTSTGHFQKPFNKRTLPGCIPAFIRGSVTGIYRDTRKLTLWFPNRSDTDRPVPSHKTASCWKIRFRKKRNCTLPVAKTKALIRFVVTVPNISSRIRLQCALLQFCKEFNNSHKQKQPLFLLCG